LREKRERYFMVPVVGATGDDAQSAWGSNLGRSNRPDRHDAAGASNNNRRSRSPCAIRRHRQSLGRKPGVKNRCTLDMNSQGDPRHDVAGQDQVKRMNLESAQQVRGA
jgi:hypothetical protein